jgi:hypothetical protein
MSLGDRRLHSAKRLLASDTDALQIYVHFGGAAEV